MCANNHLFDASPSSITNKWTETWCPLCRNKTETLVYEFLSTFTDQKFIREFRFDKLGLLRFDFCFPKFKLIFEIDGEQHFSQVSNWTNPEKTRENDILKMKFALSQGYTIVRIYQPDIAKDILDWKSVIVSHLKFYQIPSVFYYASNSYKYDNHKQFM